MKNKIARLDTKTSYIYKSIKSDILKGYLQPGRKLVIAKLAKEFGVSAIPVREAVNQLMAEDFLDNVPHTGMYVKEINIDYLKEIYPIRGVLEGYATRLAVPILTDLHLEKLTGISNRLEELIRQENFKKISSLNYAFHMLIYREAGNSALLKMIDDLIKTTDRVRIVYDLMPERAASSNSEHRNIILALSKRDADGAAHLISDHVQETLRVLIGFIQKENEA